MRFAIPVSLTLISQMSLSLPFCYAAPSAEMLADAQISPSTDAEQLVGFNPPQDLLKRAQGGNLDAQLELAYLYSQPEHYDALSMYSWFLKAARGGSLEAQATVGFLLLEGIGTPAHSPTAILWLELAAQRHDTESQLLLASIFLNGSYGVPRDLKSAFRYFKQASESGDSQAQLMLAICYQNGLGCEVDHELALAYAKKSAAQLNAQALCMMGDLSRKNVPHGTKNDRATAARPVDSIARAYYLHAAFLGQMKASYELAKEALMESGKNRMQDSETKKKAVVELLDHAAMEGYQPAMYELALCYRWGYGVERDDEYAADLLVDAAVQGYEPARYMLAYLHAIGDGVEYSLQEAYAWIYQEL